MHVKVNLLLFAVLFWCTTAIHAMEGKQRKLILSRPVRDILATSWYVMDYQEDIEQIEHNSPIYIGKNGLIKIGKDKRDFLFDGWMRNPDISELRDTNFYKAIQKVSLDLKSNVYKKDNLPILFAYADHLAEWAIYMKKPESKRLFWSKFPYCPLIVQVLVAHRFRHLAFLKNEDTPEIESYFRHEPESFKTDMTNNIVSHIAVPRSSYTNQKRFLVVTDGTRKWIIVSRGILHSMDY